MSNIRNSELAKKLNSLQFCSHGASTPLKQLASQEISALNIGSKIRFSDFNEKTLSKLVSGEISAILELECSSYAYVPNSSIRPLTNDNIEEFIAAGEPLGELNELPIAKFGRKIRTEDITELGIGHLEITIYQNVTKFIVKVIETWINDKQWRESHAEECDDDSCLSIHTSVWGPSWVTHEVLDDELGAYCHIDYGGIEEGLHGVLSLGYTIDHEFGVTTHYNMNDADWSGTVHFANPEN